MSIGKLIEKALEGTDYEGQSFGSLFGRFLGSWLAQITGSQATGRDRDLASLQLGNQQILNEEEYDRKIDFYERFESPEARVRQFKQAGLNPMLLAGNGASVSASGGAGAPGSASASASGSGGFADVLGTILGVMKFGVEKRIASSEIAARRASTDAQIIDNEYKRQLNELEIERRRKDIEKTGTEIEINLQTLEKLCYETEFAEIYAAYAPDLFDVQIEQGYSTAEMNEARAELDRNNASLTEDRRREIEARINLDNAEAAQIRENIRKISEEVKLIGSQKDLTDAQKEESLQRVKNLRKECELLGKKIDITQKDIDWYASNHTEVVDYDKSQPLNPGTTYKDIHGTYTVYTDGKITYNRPMFPNVNAKGKRTK